MAIFGRSSFVLGSMCALAAAASSVACTPVVHNTVSSASAPAHGITVSGIGKVSAKPNVARSTVGVEARATSAEAAIGEVNARMAQVIAAVKQAGVADADVRTATLSLNFERSYEQPPRPVEPELAPAVEPAAAAGGKSKPAIAKAAVAPAPAPVPALPRGFYTATNNVEVTIRNLDQAGKVLSAATSAGANQLFGLRFEIEEPAALLAEARKKAVADADRRARALAQLASVKLGPAVSITELDGNTSGPVPAFAMMKSEAAAPVEQGEVSLTSSVQIVYSLAD